MENCLFLQLFFFPPVNLKRGRGCVCETSEHVSLTPFTVINYDMISYIFSVLLYDTSLSVFPMVFLTQPVHLSCSEFLNMSISVTSKLFTSEVNHFRIDCAIYLYFCVYTHTQDLIHEVIAV